LLALGIGRTSAVFSLLIRCLLGRADPWARQGRGTYLEGGKIHGLSIRSDLLSYPMYRACASERVFSDACAFRLPLSVDMRVDERLLEMVSGSYFNCSGTASVGRVFDAEARAVSGREREPLLSHEYWHQFNAIRSSCQRILVKDHSRVVGRGGVDRRRRTRYSPKMDSGHDEVQ